MDTQESSKKSPLRERLLQITKKDEMKGIFRNQVDSLKVIRQTMGELQQLNKTSQQKQKLVKDNYENSLSNFHKIRKDLDVIHKSIVKVLVCEERIQSIHQERQKLNLQSPTVSHQTVQLQQKQDHQTQVHQSQNHQPNFEKIDLQNRVILQDINIDKGIHLKQYTQDDTNQLQLSIESKENEQSLKEDEQEYSNEQQQQQLLEQKELNKEEQKEDKEQQNEEEQDKEESEQKDEEKQQKEEFIQSNINKENNINEKEQNE